MGFNGGNVTVDSADFYGVDTNAVEDYVKRIQAVAITEAIAQLRETGKLFSTLRDGWVGQAEKNFETNFETARNNVIKALGDGFTALVSEINQIGQGWIDQDSGMVQVQGGER